MSIEELAKRGGVPVRTIRFYISEGLLPGPAGRGRAATYGEEHLLRLRLIRLLVQQRVPLAEIRERLTDLDLASIRQMLATEEQRERRLQRAAESASPQEYVAALLDRARAARDGQPERRRSRPRSLRFAAPMPLAEEPPALYAPAPVPAAAPDVWRRWVLAPGVELQVRADATDEAQALVARLLETAGIPAEEITDSESSDQGGAQ